MKFDMNAPLRDLDDEPIVESVYEKNENGPAMQCDCGKVVNPPVKTGESIVTLGKTARSALMSLDKDEQDLSGDKKNDRFWLAMRIKKVEKNTGICDLELDDANLVKKLVDKKFGPVIVARVRELLENPLIFEKQEDKESTKSKIKKHSKRK